MHEKRGPVHSNRELGSTLAESPINKTILAKVIKIHRDNNTVDIVAVTGEPYRRVPVMSPALGTRSGSLYIQGFSAPGLKDTAFGPIAPFIDDRDRSIFAVVGFLGDSARTPIVLGFILPNTNQMTFNREGFSINRHESDTYTMLENGLRTTYDPTTKTTIPNFEWYHSSGFFVRVGEGTEHEDLTGQDIQKLWRVRGTANANTTMGTAGPDSADYVPITMKHPSGTGVTLDNDGVLNIHTGPTGHAQVNGCFILHSCNVIEGANITIEQGPGDQITISSLGGGEGREMIAGEHITLDFTTTTITINAEWPPDYVLPIASPTILGGVKVGSGLTIDGGGVLSAVVTPDIDNFIATVSKSGSVVGPRPNLNFIAGPNVTVVVADDSGTDSIDVTIASTASLGGSVIHTTVYSALPAKAFNLWNGSSNNAPPANWYTTTFVDTSWGAAVNATGIVLLPGCTNIWSSTLPVSPSEQCLLRQHFTIPAGTVFSANLTIWCDDGAFDFYINGNLISSSIDVGGGIHTWSMPASYFNAGGDNLIAIRAYNTSFSWAYANYVLDIFSISLPVSTDAGLTFLMNGFGSILLTGVQGDLIVPFPCTITGVTLLADVTTNLVMDIWKGTYSSYPPVIGGSICGSSLPTISSSNKAQDTTLTGWSKTLIEGDILRFNLNSVTAATKVTVLLEVSRT